MALQKKTFVTDLYGSELELSLSDLAGQANAAVLARWGETVVFATVVMGGQDTQGDFFPLTVDYEERFYAVGKVLGSRFVRREGRPSDEAILSARLIDRTIRPLFDSRLRREVQVVVTVFAYDEEHDPDLVSLIAVSTALGISDIPWDGPVGAAQYTEKDGERLHHHAFFAGTADRVNMIEFEGAEVSETEAESVFAAAQKDIATVVAFQNTIIKAHAKPKAAVRLAESDPRVRALVADFVKNDLVAALREKRLGELKASLLAHLKQSGEGTDVLKVADIIFEETINAHVHTEAIKNSRRVDGRALDEVRPLDAEVGLFRRTHGSALFVRGTTQVLATTTLASPSAEQLIETMEMSGRRRFMLHYNFPGFSVGEVYRSRGPGRREIGHGALAAKALRALIPTKEEFPYTIRIVAETLSSNGSSSMATTCASSLALMDAGVPFKKHVAGIAIGLMIHGDAFKILTDIQGPEDHHGDMDFKVAGTRDGITAIQMDVKIGGITATMFHDALVAGRQARFRILDVMEGILPNYRPELSPHAPRIFTLHIDPSRIGELIGPGGKTINGIIADAGGDVSIDIDEDGTVFIASAHQDRADKAIAVVESMFREFTVGEVVSGTVVRLMEFGAIVDLGGRQDGMVHVSEMGEGFVKNVGDAVKMSQRVQVKVVRVENGRIGLSMKGVPQG